LEFLLPVGGYDLDRLSTSEICLRHSAGGEGFYPLGHSPDTSPEKTQPGEIVYSESERVLTRAWNRKECESPKITEETSSIALFAEAADPLISANDVTGIAERIKHYVLRFCGGSAQTYLINVSERNTWDLSL